VRKSVRSRLKRVLQKSISRELNIYLTICIAVVQIIVFLFVYNTRSQEMDVMYRDMAEDYTEKIRESLAIPMWYFDEEQVEMIGNIYMNHQDVQKVQINDDLGNTVFFAQKLDSHRTISRSTSINYRDTVIGKVDLEISLKQYDRSLNQIKQDTIFLIIGALLSILVLNNLILRILIQKSFRGFQQNMDSLAAGDFAFSEDSQVRTEMRGIANRFNQMARKVRAREIALQELNENQDRVIRERTAELTKINKDLEKEVSEHRETERQLLKKTEEAEAASRIKSRFLANMSHEIRTPMNGVLGMTDLLLNTPLTTQQQEYLRAIKTSGDSLLTIINDILDFSKIEAGKVQLDIFDFNLRTLISNSLSTVRSRAEEQNITLAAQVDHRLPENLSGDPGKIRQVLLNLVNNAIKFTDKGRVTLEARLVSRDEKSLQLQFSVSDTGIGIPADRIHTIFHSFEQVDGSTSRKFGGSGLGLTISQQLVLLMGGRIEVESKPGRGSQFFFTIGLGVSAEESRTQKPPEAVPPILLFCPLKDPREALEEMIRSWDAVPLSYSGYSCPGTADVPPSCSSTGFAIIRITDDFPKVKTLEDDLIHSHGWDPNRIIHLIPDGLYQAWSDFDDAESLHLPATPLESYTLRAIVAEEKIEVRKRNHTRSEAPRATQKNSRPLAVLLVEDNKINQVVAGEMLKRLGHRVSIAESGKSALQLWEKEKFDLIFMDIQMPEMDGITATRILRGKDGGKQVPIIAMTAHAMKGDEDRFIEAGMDGYISKPIEQTLVFSVLERYCQDNSPAHPTMEWNSLVKKFFGDENFVRQIVETFLEQLPSLLVKLDMAIKDGDGRDISEAAHTIKGAVGNFQTGPAFESALTLESASREGASREELQDLSRVLKEHLHRLSREFELYLATESPATSD